jgi:hypothetical protein
MKVLFNGKDKAGEFYRKIFAGYLVTLLVEFLKYQKIYFY